MIKSAAKYSLFTGTVPASCVTNEGLGLYHLGP